jgi:putative FmdB family regulatory protein
MPLFEYVCRECQRHFEQFVTGDRQPSCPACQSRELDKQLSTFAVSTASSGRESAVPMGACGTCGDPRGPGACSLN